MAKNKKENTGTGTKRIIAVTLLIVLVLGFITTWAIGSEGFAQNNPLKFFNGWGHGVVVNEELEAQKNRFMLSTEDGPNNPTKLIILPAGDRQIAEESPKNIAATTAGARIAYPAPITGSVAPNTERSTVTTYVLQVVTEPAETEDIFVWRCTNTEAISVDVATDTRSATVKCKAGFGEPVTISATSNVNAEVTASVKADYIKRVVAMEYTLNPGQITFSNTGSVEHNLTFNPVYGVGTIEPEIRLASGIQQNAIELNFECTDGDYSTRTLYFSDSTFNVTDPYSAFGGYDGESWANEGGIADWIKLFRTKVTGTTSDATMLFIIEYVYGGKTYGSCSFKVPVALNLDSLHTYASNVTITPPNGGVIF